jgi:hypothetical protein
MCSFSSISPVNRALYLSTPCQHVDVSIHFIFAVMSLVLSCNCWSLLLQLSFSFFCISISLYSGSFPAAILCSAPSHPNKGANKRKNIDLPDSAILSLHLHFLTSHYAKSLHLPILGFHPSYPGLPAFHVPGCLSVLFLAPWLSPQTTSGNSPNYFSSLIFSLNS